jgi:hypothetical protein
MSMSLGDIASMILSVLLRLLGPVIGFIIVAVRATGRARTLGMIGFGVAAVLAVIGTATSYALPRILAELDLPIAVVYGAWNAVFNLLDIIPMIILAFAIIAYRHPAGVAPGVRPDGSR